MTLKYLFSLRYKVSYSHAKNRLDDFIRVGERAVSSSQPADWESWIKYVRVNWPDVFEAKPNAPFFVEERGIDRNSAIRLLIKLKNMESSRFYFWPSFFALHTKKLRLKLHLKILCRRIAIGLIALALYCVSIYMLVNL